MTTSANESTLRSGVVKYTIADETGDAKESARRWARSSEKILESETAESFRVLGPLHRNSDFSTTSSRWGSPPARPSPFMTELDEHGRSVVSDLHGAAVGVGGTPAEALAQWEDLAADLLDDLLECEDRLHPKMHPRLAFLRSWFAR